MKCEDVGMLSVMGNWDELTVTNIWFAGEDLLPACIKECFRVGYETRRLTGKLVLTGNIWDRGWTESCHVDLRSLIMMRKFGVEYKKCPKLDWDILFILCQGLLFVE